MGFSAGIKNSAGVVPATGFQPPTGISPPSENPFYGMTHSTEWPFPSESKIPWAFGKISGQFRSMPGKSIKKSRASQRKFRQLQGSRCEFYKEGAPIQRGFQKVSRREPPGDPQNLGSRAGKTRGKFCQKLLLAMEPAAAGSSPAPGWAAEILLL
jgi:hypothetical protein